MCVCDVCVCNVCVCARLLLRRRGERVAGRLSMGVWLGAAPLQALRGMQQGRRPRSNQQCSITWFAQSVCVCRSGSACVWFAWFPTCVLATSPVPCACCACRTHTVGHTHPSQVTANKHCGNTSTTLLR